MTSSTARSGDFQDLSSLQRFALSFDRSGREDFLDRMARLDAARDTRPADSTPPHDDDALVLAGRALDEAWALEVHALILAKRARNAEATAAAQAARQATARIVQRIEAAAASSAEDYRVKARAALWRRNGEPAKSRRA